MKLIVDGNIYHLQSHGGISRIFSEILPRICNYDEKIYIQILLNKKNIQSLPQHKHITYQPTYKIDPYFRPWRFWKSRLTSVKEEINSIIIGNSKNMVWHSTYYTLPRRWKGAVVATVYDLIRDHLKDTFYSEERDDEIRKKIRDSVTFSDKVISISNTTKQDLQNIYGIAAEKIQVIYLACNEIFKQVVCHDCFEKPFILYVGTRTKYKNFLGLLKTYSVWNKNNEVDFIAVGKDWSAGESKIIAELRISGNVHLIRNVDDISLRDLYNQALAFVYPSLYEGFGIPILEAMSCGCPIIASRIPSTVEIAGEVPVYHEPGNCDELLFNLDQIYNEVRPSDRSLKGLNHVKQYSWDRTARQTAQLYRNITSS
jgi:glycosyltransferase involved in cell wall biosynthesis